MQYKQAQTEPRRQPWSLQKSLVNVVTTPPELQNVEAALTRPVPRRVRASRSLRRTRAWAVNIALACIAVCAFAPSFPVLYDYLMMLWLAVLPLGACLWRELAAREQKRLLRNGTPVHAVVLNMACASSARVNDHRYSVTFGFVTDAGEAVTRTVELDDARAARLRADGSATLLYHAGDAWGATPYFALTDVELE